MKWKSRKHTKDQMIAREISKRGIMEGIWKGEIACCQLRGSAEQTRCYLLLPNEASSRAEREAKDKQEQAFIIAFDSTGNYEKRLHVSLEAGRLCEVVLFCYNRLLESRII